MNRAYMEAMAAFALRRQYVEIDSARKSNNIAAK